MLSGSDLKAERERAIANLQRPVILVCWVNKNVFQCLLKYKYMLKAIFIIEINHITHLNHLGRLTGVNCGNKLHSGRLTFLRKNKSIEG